MKQKKNSELSGSFGSGKKKGCITDLDNKIDIFIFDEEMNWMIFVFDI